MSSSFQNMCRTCMVNESKQSKEEVNKSKVKKKTRMVSILSVPKDIKEEHSLMELLKTSAPQLKIEENDQLPKIVCLECSEKIKELYRFQQNCLSVEQKLYKMLEQQPNETFDDNVEDVDIFKTEFDDPFMEENSMESDEDLIVEDDIKMESVEKDEFTGNGSDLSIDFVWDDKSDSDWEDDLPLKRKLNTVDTSATYKKEEIDDEEFQTFSYDEDDVVEDDEFVDYKPHTTRKSDISKPFEAPQLYPCSRCKRKLKSKLSLEKHLEMHDKRDSEGPKFVCNICDRAFKEHYMLRDHARTHSGEKPYLCSECGKGFTSSGSLKQHSYRHLEEKPFACPECPKTFPTRTDLSSHYDVHKARPRSHICDICGRGFPKPFLLKKHKMYHNNVRPFSCEYCDKSFVTNEKLQRHTRIHTGEKPYKCSYCEKAYCQSNELTKHLRCHLGENVYQCELCPLRFPTVKIVREHFSTHKNDDEKTKAQNLAELQALDIKGIYCR